MHSLFETHNPLPGLGMASTVLGLIALLLAFLPILGIPISAFGLLFGLCGLIALLFARSTSLRWSLAGLAVSALALVVNVALLYAPLGYQPGTLAVPEPWQPVPDRPAVPPPARGEGWLPTTEWHMPGRAVGLVPAGKTAGTSPAARNHDQSNVSAVPVD